MKREKIILIIAVIITSLNIKAQTDTIWTKQKAENWFSKMEWFNNSQQHAKKYDAFGREVENETPDTSAIINSSLKPDPSVNTIQFAKDYQAHPSRWDKAFYYLQHTDFSTLGAGRYQVDGDDVYAVITMGPAKKMDTTMWEAHHNYDDIHYVIDGKEKLGIAPLSQAKLIKAYEPDHDIAHYGIKGKYYEAAPGTFFIITTKEVHRPNLQTNGSGIVKKLYIKVKIN